LSSLVRQLLETIVNKNHLENIFSNNEAFFFGLDKLLSIYVWRY